MEELKKRGHDLAVKLIQKFRLDLCRRVKRHNREHTLNYSDIGITSDASSSDDDTTTENEAYFELYYEVDGQMKVFTTTLPPSESIGRKFIALMEDVSQLEETNCISTTVSTQTDDGQIGQVLVELRNEEQQEGFSSQEETTSLEKTNFPSFQKREQKRQCCQYRHPFCMSTRQRVLLEILSPAYFVPSKVSYPKWITIPMNPIPSVPNDIHLFRLPKKVLGKGSGEKISTYKNSRFQTKPLSCRHTNLRRLYIDEGRPSRVYNTLSATNLANAKPNNCKRCENKRKKPIRPSRGQKMQPGSFRTTASRSAEIEVTVLSGGKDNYWKAADRWREEFDRQTDHPPFSFIGRFQWCLRLAVFHLGMEGANLMTQTRTILY